MKDKICTDCLIGMLEKEGKRERERMEESKKGREGERFCKIAYNNRT
jgi:hypothetical protein